MKRRRERPPALPWRNAVATVATMQGHLTDTGARAAYASHSTRSRGRLVAEPESSTRTCFQRDRDRIVHARSFRRLQYKTQVFVYHEGVISAPG